MIKENIALSLFIVMFGLAPSSVQAQEDRVMPFHELARLMGVAADAVAKIGEGFRQLVDSQSSAYNLAAAERDRNQLRFIERQRLLELSRKTQDLVAEQKPMVLNSMSDYLSLPKPTPADWEQVKQNVDSVLSSVGVLLEDVRREKSEFVLEPAFLELNEGLHARNALLTKLKALPMPSSDEKKKALRQVYNKYVVLRENTKSAIREMNLYLKDQKEH